MDKVANCAFKASEKLSKILPPVSDTASSLRVSQAMEAAWSAFRAGQSTAARSSLTSAEKAASLAVEWEAAGESLSDTSRSTESLRRVDAALAKRRVRPSALLPFWQAAGFTAGAAAALAPAGVGRRLGAAVAKLAGAQANDNLRLTLRPPGRTSASGSASPAEQDLADLGELRTLFKLQRDDASRAALAGRSAAEFSEEASLTSGGATREETDAKAAVKEALKGALRLAAGLTGRV